MSWRHFEGLTWQANRTEKMQRKWYYQISITETFYDCPVANVIFYSCNLQIFVISQSVCPWQAFLVQSNVCGQRPRYYPNVEHLRGVSLGQAPALPAKIRLGWKDLPETKALAYYKNSSITSVESFITLFPGGIFENLCKNQYLSY